MKIRLPITLKKILIDPTKFITIPMKKFFLISLLAGAVAAFSGCSTVAVDIPGSKFASEAVWTGRTLENVRYYNSNVDAVREAAIKAVRDMNLYFAGDTPNKSGVELFVCGPKFAKITIDITRRVPRADKKGTPAGPEYTEVEIVYGTWGDLQESKAIVSGISKNLPSEA